MSVSEYRLEFAATVFVRECLRQYLKMHPGIELEDLPMKALVDYPLREQRALQQAVAKAIEASTGMNDLYRTFVEEKIAVARERAAQSQTTTE